MTELDLRYVDQCIEQLGQGPEQALPILQALQRHYGYLPPEALERVCHRSRIRAADLSEIATFYDQFRLRPAGRTTIQVCVGTACHVKGADAVYDAFKRHLGLGPDQDTDAQGEFTVSRVACLGCCTLAPAVQIGPVTFGHVRPETVGQVLEEARQALRRKDSPPAPTPTAVSSSRGQIRLGLGSCCQARGSEALRVEIESIVRREAIPVEIQSVGCVGMCHQTPLLEVVLPGPQRFLYARVEPADAREILRRHFPARRYGQTLRASLSRRLEQWVCGDRAPRGTQRVLDARERQVTDFLGHQVHIATESCGVLDPTNMEQYQREGGFDALRRCLAGTLSAETVLEQLHRSGLRGRGGAGFPTAKKWTLLRQQPGRRKFVVCNGDEGDPGAFMDRMLMESYPFRILEGMMIAGFVTGAEQGLLYIRAEYPLAMQRIQEAIEACRQAGFLGEDALGSGRRFDLQTVAGAGAFVCGEETALLASIMGRRGEPRYRPPYPVQSGLWDCPTLINNVETLASVPWILRQGGQAYATLGTASSPGTKVFALAGKVARGGLIEVPMGITLGQIVNEIGGGVAEGRTLKAVQIGGPSGGCLPASLMHLPVDYESLTEAGAMMGSGGLVVLDDTDCMVDVARYFLQFTQNQSCGKCTFCRVGTRRMLEILERLCAGQGTARDVDRLEHLAGQVRQGSLCGLGRTAPNPVLTTLRYFRQEIEAHVAGRCPAGRCPQLIRFVINERCIGCTLCAQQCPVEAITAPVHRRHEIDSDRCIRCGACRQICPEQAVEVQS